MKTLKIKEDTHKKLMILKNWYSYRTIDETLDMILTEYAYQNDDGRLYGVIKNVDK